MSDNTPLKPTQWPTRSASLNMLKPALMHEIKRKPVAENISSPKTSLNFQYPPRPSSKDDTQRVLASDCSDISTNSSSTSSSSSKTRKQELQDNVRKLTLQSLQDEYFSIEAQKLALDAEHVAVDTKKKAKSSRIALLNAERIEREHMRERHQRKAAKAVEEVENMFKEMRDGEGELAEMSRVCEGNGEVRSAAAARREEAMSRISGRGRGVGGEVGVEIGGEMGLWEGKKAENGMSNTGEKVQS